MFVRIGSSLLSSGYGLVVTKNMTMQEKLLSVSTHPEAVVLILSKPGLNFFTCLRVVRLAWVHVFDLFWVIISFAESIDIVTEVKAVCAFGKVYPQLGKFRFNVEKWF